MITLKGNAGAASFIRFTIIGLSAIVFLWIISVVAIGVSAISRTSRSALLSLLGVWLMLAIVLPKTLQAIGNYLYPAPGKIQFQAAVEEDILKQGDSHNPDDVHFKKLKDSILRANKVDSIQQLSFNYSGFIMQEGERMSAQVYNAHLQRLHNIYDKQNGISYNAAFINPIISFKNITMAFSGTDFAAYRYFQQQAETYRYDLAQTMNVLQMKYISNKKLSSTDKPYSIDKSHWTSFPDFKYQYQPVSVIIKQQWVALMALAVWLVMSVLFINYIAVKAKVI
jgi:ABC-2 type transport system permease protein